MSNIKKINLAQCTSLVTGNLLGSGIFMLPVLLAPYGSSSILAWVITSVGAVFLALVFAKLSLAVADAEGGPHFFISKAFGKSPGFWAAWGYWVLTWSSNTALIVAATSYLSKIFGDFSGAEVLIIQLVIWAVITIINLSGVRNAAVFELIITVFKLVPIVLIPVVAVFFLKLDNFTQFLPVDGGFTVAQSLKSCMFLILWAFIGVESATVPAKEIKDPKKTIGIATVLGTGIAAIVYIMGAVAIIGVLGNDALISSTAPYADLAKVVFGGSWGKLIAVFAVISCVGAFNGWSLVVARIAHGAAEQGLFPAVFIKTNKANTPINSILISSFCTLCAIFFTLEADMLLQFNVIINIAVTLILFVYLGSVMAYFKIVKIRTLLDNIIGCGAFLFAGFGVYASGYLTITHALLLLGTGIPFYFIMLHKSR